MTQIDMIYTVYILFIDVLMRPAMKPPTHQVKEDVPEDACNGHPLKAGHPLLVILSRPFTPFRVNSESLACRSQILRFAQNDK